MRESVTQPEIHPKGWGRELWIANNEKYCGKILELSKGKQCSIHFHKLKDETFHILAGPVELHLWKEYPGEQQTIVLQQGDSLRLMPGLIHRFKGLEDSKILEISTQHFEEDSYRHVKGD